MRTSNNASSQIAIPSFLNTSTISTYSSRIVVVYQSYIHLLYNVKTCRAGPELAQNSHWTLLGPQPPQPARPARQGRQTRQAPALLLGPSSWASKNPPLPMKSSNSWRWSWPSFFIFLLLDHIGSISEKNFEVPEQGSKLVQLCCNPSTKATIYGDRPSLSRSLHQLAKVKILGPHPGSWPLNRRVTIWLMLELPKSTALHLLGHTISFSCLHQGLPKPT